MKAAARIVGVLWVLQGLAFAVEEVARVVRAEPGVSLGVALLLYAIVVAVGVHIMLRAKGWTIVAVVASGYQGVSHFIFLSNVWPEIDYSAAFSLFVVSLAIATGVLAAVQWTSKGSSANTAPSVR